MGKTRSSPIYSRQFSPYVGEFSWRHSCPNQMLKFIISLGNDVFLNLSVLLQILLTNAVSIACERTFNKLKPVNSIFISGKLTPNHLDGQKVKPRWPPIEGNFGRQFQSSSRSCTSVPVLCTTLIFSFCLVRLRKHSQPWKRCSDEILQHQFYIIECLKGLLLPCGLRSVLNCQKMVN